MRTRRSGVIGWKAWLAAGITALVIAVAAGLIVYAGRVQPVQHPVEQIIPNDRLPN